MVIFIQWHSSNRQTTPIENKCTAEVDSNTRDDGDFYSVTLAFRQTTGKAVPNFTFVRVTPGPPEVGRSVGET